MHQTGVDVAFENHRAISGEAASLSGLTCWVVTDGKAGMENQCVGLAEAIGLKPIVKRIQLRFPWKQISPFITLGARYSASSKGDSINPPWPDVIIASGRQSIAPMLGAARANKGRAFTIYIQNPQISPRNFDLVVVPQHDKLRAPNVVTTRGALHHVTPQKLADAAERFAPALAHLPHPRIAVLIGGTNDVYRLTPTIMGDVAEKLMNMSRRYGAGLMITPSRRTGADNEAILRARMQDVPAVVWDGTGENPYFGYLGLADAVVVTCDSVSMISEACSTGKPVYVVELDGGSPKFRAFQNSLYEQGVARPFTGELETWSYKPLHDTTDIAAIARKMLLDKMGRQAR